MKEFQRQVRSCALIILVLGVFFSIFFEGWSSGLILGIGLGAQLSWVLGWVVASYTQFVELESFLIHEELSWGEVDAIALAKGCGWRMVLKTEFKNIVEDHPGYFKGDYWVADRRNMTVSSVDFFKIIRNGGHPKRFPAILVRNLQKR